MTLLGIFISVSSRHGFFIKINVDKNIFFPKSVIPENLVSLNTIIYDCFYTFIDQRGFLFNYIFIGKIYPSMGKGQIFGVFVKILYAFTIVIFFGVPYICYIFTSVFLVCVYKEKKLNVERLFCIELRKRFVFDSTYGTCCIRIFNGQIKLNGNIFFEQLKSCGFYKNITELLLHTKVDVI